MSDKVQIHIVEKAAEMFFNFGIRSVTIDDICRELGISKKTFYVYFSGKDDLVEKVLAHNVEHFAHKMESWLVGKTVQELLWGYSLKLQRTKDEDVRCVPKLVYDLNKYYPRLAEAHNREMMALQSKYLARILERGVAEGFVRANIDIESISLMCARMHGDIIMHLQEVNQHGMSTVRYSRAAMDVIVRGLLTEKGLEAFEN